MPFYTYIVRCIDASYYVGHTDDLEKRISDHNSGGLSAYTRKRRPVKLVWAEESQTREEALARERQLQGWSRGEERGPNRGQLGPPPSPQPEHRGDETWR